MKQPLINQEERRSGNVAFYLLGVVLLVAGFAGGRVLYRNGVSEVAVAGGGNDMVDNPGVQPGVKDGPGNAAYHTAEKIPVDPKTNPEFMTVQFHAQREDAWCTVWCTDNAEWPEGVTPTATGNNKQCKNDQIPDTPEMAKNDDLKDFHQCTEAFCKCKSAKWQWGPGGAGDFTGTALDPNKGAQAQPEADAAPAEEKEVVPDVDDPDEIMQDMTVVVCPPFAEAINLIGKTHIAIINMRGFYLCAIDAEQPIGTMFKTINTLFTKTAGGFNRKVTKLTAFNGVRLDAYERWAGPITAVEPREIHTVYDNIEADTPPLKSIPNSCPFHTAKAIKGPDDPPRTNWLFVAFFDEGYGSGVKDDPEKGKIAIASEEGTCKDFCNNFVRGGEGRKLFSPFARTNRVGVTCQSLKITAPPLGDKKRLHTYSGCTEGKCC